MKGAKTANALRTGLLMALMVLSATASRSTEMPLFSPDAYGKTVLPLNESLGRAAEIIRKQGNIFEPLSQLRKDDPLRMRARAIGRLDLLVENNGRKALITCTASIVSKDLLLTNYHCIPGKKGHIVKASLLLDYEKTDGSGTTRLEVDPTSVEGDANLDYSLARLKSPVPADISPLPVVAEDVKPRQQLLMIHHPAGQIKKMSRFRCRAAKSTRAHGPYLRHICESLPGSSGGILFNTATGAVGLHHSGGLDRNNPDSFNKGTLLERLLAASSILKAAVGNRPGKKIFAKQPGREPKQASSDSNSGSINDILTQP